MTSTARYATFALCLLVALVGAPPAVLAAATTTTLGGDTTVVTGEQIDLLALVRPSPGSPGLVRLMRNGQEVQADTPTPNGAVNFDAFVYVPGTYTFVAEYEGGPDSDPSSSEPHVVTVSEAPGARRLQVLAPEVETSVDWVRMTRDGGWVLFESTLHPITNQPRSDTYVSVAGRYLPTDLGSNPFVRAISDDGARMIVSTNNKLLTADTDSSTDFYLIEGSSIELISIGTTGSSNQFDRASRDLSVVIFQSREALSPNDPGTDQDLYRWDRGSSTLTLLTDGIADPQVKLATEDFSHVIVGSTGFAPLGYEPTPGGMIVRSAGSPRFMTSDGSRLYFTSPDQLVPADTDAKLDVYWSDVAGTFHLVTGWTDLEADFAAISPDGTSYVLRSTDKLQPADPDTSSDLYLVDASGVTLVTQGTVAVGSSWISEDLSQIVYRTLSQIDPSDVEQDADLYRWNPSSPWLADLITTRRSGNAGVSVHAMSPDGDRFVFNADSSVLPGEVATGYDGLYEWHDGSTVNLAPGTGLTVHFVAASEDLSRLVIETAEALLPEGDPHAGGFYISDADRVPPSVTIDPLAGGSSTADVSISFEASGAIWFDCTVDAAPAIRCSSPLALADLPIGAHELSVTAWDAAGNPSPPASMAWTVIADTVPPVGTVSIAGGAAFSATTSVTVGTAATDTDSGLSQVALSNDGTTWTTRPYGATQAWTLPSTNGARTVHVKWRDVAGNWSAVKTDTIVLDTVAPTAGALGRTFLKGKALANGAILTRFTWTGADTTSGVARYELGQQIDGGAWATVSTTLTGTLTDRPLATEKTYRFRVRAADKAGNVGPWAYVDSFRVTRISETSSRIRYSGTWSISKATAFWGGQVKASSRAGSRATVTISSRRVAWIASMGPTRGKAEVYVNGIKVATVDLYSASSKHQQVVWTGSWTTSASRTISIRVLGTSGRPRGDVDAFVTAD